MNPQDNLPNTDDTIDLLDIAIILAKHLRLLIVGPLLAGLAALGLSFLIKPTFTATTVLLTPQQQQGAAMAALQSLGSLASMAGAAAGLKNPADQYVSLLQSNRIADRIIDKHKLIEIYESEMRMDARKTLGNNTTIAAGKKDNLITISVDDTDPQRAADIANAYVAELHQLSADLALTEAQQRRRFFEDQLKTVKSQLIDAQKSLQLSSVNQGTLRADPSSAVMEYAQIKAQVTATEVKLQSLRTHLTEDTLEVRQALGELNALRVQMARAEKADSASAGSDYLSKLRDFKYYEALFELFSKQFELAKIDESRDSTLIQVVDQATAPERKSKPKKAIIAILTTFGTGCILLMYVLIRQMIGRAHQSPYTKTKLAQLRAALQGAFGRRQVHR